MRSIHRLKYMPFWRIRLAILTGVVIWSLASPRGQCASPEPINFVSYNLKNYLPMKRTVDGVADPEAPKPEREVEEAVNILTSTKPDILGVCEIGGKDDAIDLQKRLKAKGISLEHIEMVGGGDPDRRLAVLSKFPISARNSQSELTYQIGGQTLPMQRGILDVTIKVNESYELRLIGIHLKSKRETPFADQALMRRNEADLVKKHASEILSRDPDTNLLVYGDFNATRNEKTVREIVGRYRTPTYLRPMRLKDEMGQTWTHYWDDADIYARIDYVCTSSGIIPEIRTGESYIASSPKWYNASDHRPLVVQIVPTNQSQ